MSPHGCDTDAGVNFISFYSDAHLLDPDVITAGVKETQNHYYRTQHDPNGNVKIPNFPARFPEYMYIPKSTNAMTQSVTCGIGGEK